ncbi:tetratricopeptide repeat protein [Parachlamydia acanthamoebae]|uniref:tetratricopeptide repeat protein n=1 Tax=Parachlamydia acanthamoebae TaxID=83552 RepID=UPI000750ECB8|nr:tetratricopeptide repeat protein [Parachlamydia acanthamoebae]
MAKINWVKSLGWTEEQLDDLRFTGYAYLRQGKYDIALAFYEALAALSPNNAYDLQTLGALYLQLNNPVKALKCFDQALKVEADHAPTLLNVAKALFMLGKKEEGLKLAQILQNEPSLIISNTAKALILAYS